MSERYEVLRRIGAGGMGVVYEALDHDRGQKVALKTIANPDVEDVYRLKREFRALADLGHPNLVTLYDLVVDGSSCFFTMELLDGEDLLAHLCPYLFAEVNTDADTVRGEVHTPSDGVVVDVAVPVEGTIVPSPCDLERLRHALPQLARGLHALHVAGKIHRDVKPSNVRVTADGRVVLLDFGLVAELDARHASNGIGLMVGTAPYMSPEQCEGLTLLTPAADWYALGVILFRALTGRLPFDGPLAAVIMNKQSEDAPPPSRYASDVPHDLEALCCELLARDPARRPSGRAVLRRLGIDTDDAAVLHVPAMPSDGDFDGREPELASLRRAFAPLEAGKASVAIVRGPSGMGKTVLIARALDEARARHGDLLVLGGRCFEREAIPYKAIDGLIDELSDWWRELDHSEARSLLPREACLLPTLFPVLSRVRAVSEAPRTTSLADPQALRTRAFAALREVLQRVAERRRIVLYLDDMQWVDRDTMALLTDLMRAPDAPPLLLILATRVEGSEPLRALAHRMDAEATLVDVGPLEREAAVRLATLQLGPGKEELAARLVDEADGSPFFLIELSRYLQHHGLEGIAGKGLDAMLAERIAELGDPARELAEMVSIAGEPLPVAVFAEATLSRAPDAARQISLLRAQRVVRTTGTAGAETVEPYHDRVREAVASGIAAERRAGLHRALATALAWLGTEEQLARHWHAAGERQRAAEHARRAGDLARSKLDFDRAARFYAMAFDGADWSDADRLKLQAQLADDYADAGRPREAADEFLAAASAASDVTALELRRRAAGTLLQSGYVEEGLALTRDVLAGVGMRMSSTPTRALISMLCRRAWLRVRGLGYRRRDVSALGQRDLTRADVCEGVSFGLALVSSFHAMDFASRFLASALRLGEPWRVSRALALEADLLAAMSAGKRARQLLGRLEDLTLELDTPQATAQLLTTRGMIDFFVGNRFRAAYDQLTEATDIYRAEVGRAGFELDSVSLFRFWSLSYLGEIGELSRRVPAMVEAAERSGNRHTAVTMQCAFPAAWLASMDHDEVDLMITDALISWECVEDGFQFQHFLALCSRIELSLYRGDPESVRPLIARWSRPMRRALLDRPPLHALLLGSTLGRHAIACAAAAPAGSARRARELRSARRYARRFRRTSLPLTQATALILESAALEVEGRDDEAIALYRRCLAELEALEVELFAPAVRNHLGRLVGGDEGMALTEAARDRLSGEGVADPEAMLSMLLPGGRS